MTLEVAKELLETLLKKNGCILEEECKQSVRQSLTGYRVWDMLNACVQSVRKIVYDGTKQAEVSQTIALYRQCRSHILEQLHALQAQREQERLKGAECIICLDAAEQICAVDRCTLICCKQFICKGCLDVYVKDTCPFCRSARTNNRFF